MRYICTNGAYRIHEVSIRRYVRFHSLTIIQVCASYNPFEVLYLDHIGPLTKDAHGNEYILVIIDAFSRWVEYILVIIDAFSRWVEL